MKKNDFPSLLKYYFLIQKRKQPQGFSFVEVLVAMTILSLAFAINLQFLLTLKIQNLEQKNTMGAVSLTKEILDELRYDWKENFDTVPIFKQTRPTTTPIVTQTINNLGRTEFTISDDRAKDFGGYKYKVVIDVCSNKLPDDVVVDPDDPDDVVDTSTCQQTASENTRTIIVQIKNKKLKEITYDSAKTSEQVYLATSATFTKLQSKTKP
jgi:prepilin-type N-terminal cleavage/methylation domain-containing protein